MDWDEIAQAVGYITMAVIGAVISIAVVIGLIQAMHKQPGTVEYIDTETSTPQRDREIEELENLYQR